MMETEMDCFTPSARLTVPELDRAFNMRAVFECCTFSFSFSELCMLLIHQYLTLQLVHSSKFYTFKIFPCMVL